MPSIEDRLAALAAFEHEYEALCDEGLPDFSRADRFGEAQARAQELLALIAERTGQDARRQDVEFLPSAQEAGWEDVLLGGVMLGSLLYEADDEDGEPGTFYPRCWICMEDECPMFDANHGIPGASPSEVRANVASEVLARLSRGGQPFLGGLYEPPPGWSPPPFDPAIWPEHALPHHPASSAR
jgi:hypothetical protein